MAPTAARPRGGWGRPTGRRPPPLLAAALVVLALVAALPHPAAGGCPDGDEELDGPRCRAVCTTSFRPCISSRWVSCGSWFWRRSCCRSSDLSVCANGREWARCYCSINSVRPAGVVLLVLAGLAIVATLLSLAVMLRRRRKAAAAVPPVYGADLGGGWPRRRRRRRRRRMATLRGEWGAGMVADPRRRTRATPRRRRTPGGGELGRAAAGVPDQAVSGMAAAPAGGTHAAMAASTGWRRGARRASRRGGGHLASCEGRGHPTGERWVQGRSRVGLARALESN
ncbi:hypothetical protein BU14_0614s0013 [Porphyra umbilicalis]|uniref:Uncharacterized protein n=1 Tax=Porphyra umbilicalis TaxID=2786 RepID=A0A1X6NQY6_PORUM|nr:hypothetical protein BU14_0614s0013 [Porphyra umbilicalis]|eukprot:OSX71039.1 hypothetical protein BU14_0614s0013 [Porphyra umbilicalis]